MEFRKFKCETCGEKDNSSLPCFFGLLKGDCDDLRATDMKCILGETMGPAKWKEIK